MREWKDWQMLWKAEGKRKREELKESVSVCEREKERA